MIDSTAMKHVTEPQRLLGEVARLLGVSYPTIAKKIADYGLG